MNAPYICLDNKPNRMVKKIRLWPSLIIHTGLLQFFTVTQLVFESLLLGRATGLCNYVERIHDVTYLRYCRRGDRIRLDDYSFKYTLLGDGDCYIATRDS